MWLLVANISMISRYCPTCEWLPSTWLIAIPVVIAYFLHIIDNLRHVFYCLFFQVIIKIVSAMF